MKGPVPTGRVCTRSPPSRTDLGETIESTPEATELRKGEYGVSKSTCTVNSSTTLEPA